MPKLDRLQPVELRDIWPNEAQDFTPWLAEEENLELLSDTLGLELELESQEIKEKFWIEFRDYMVQKGSQLRCPKPGPWNFLIFSIGRTDFSLEPRISKQKAEIGIRLYTKGKNATAHFHLLKTQRDSIEKEFGETLEWAELAQHESSRMSLKKGDTDPTDEDDWKNQHAWLAAKLERFDKVFRPRIRALNADDWEPFEDEDEILDL